MPPLDPQLFGLARLGVERDLRRRDAGRRLDRPADDDRVAVRKPAHDSSGIVRRGRAVRADDRVVVLAASHPGGGESCAELYALDRRNREKQVAHRAFDRVEERFAQRGRYAGRGAFDDASDRVLSPQRLLDDFREVVRIVTIVDLDDPAFDLDLATENLLGYDAGRYQPERQPAREVPVAPVVVEAAELAGGDPVGVRGAGMGDEVGIVAREGVLVAEQNGQRRSGRPALEQAGSDFRKVAFLAGRRTPLAAFAAVQVLFERFLVERDAGRYAVERNADQRPVRLAENRDPE